MRLSVQVNKSEEAGSRVIRDRQVMRLLHRREKDSGRRLGVGDGRQSQLSGIGRADGVEARTGWYLVVQRQGKQAGTGLNGSVMGLSKSEYWKDLHEGEDNLARSGCGAGA